MKCNVRKVIIKFETTVTYPLDYEYTSDDLPKFDDIASKKMDLEDGEWDVWTENYGTDDVESVDFDPETWVEPQ